MFLPVNITREQQGSLLGCESTGLCQKRVSSKICYFAIRNLLYRKVSKHEQLINTTNISRQSAPSLFNSIDFCHVYHPPPLHALPQRITSIRNTLYTPPDLIHQMRFILLSYHFMSLRIKRSGVES